MAPSVDWSLEDHRFHRQAKVGQLDDLGDHARVSPPP